MLILKSGAKLRFFFGLCKCLSDNFLKYFLCVIFCSRCYRYFKLFCKIFVRTKYLYYLCIINKIINIIVFVKCNFI